VGGRIVVVGLGPAGADLVLPAARRALEQTANRYVRTARHPAVDDLAAAGIELRSFDVDYDAADDLDDVYDRIVAELLDAAGSAGEVVYAVPGNPAVAERTVELLRAAAAKGDVVLEIVPGLSFAELAWLRLGVDPMSGARVADARRLTAEDAVGDGPLLVAQCDTRLLLSDVKLVLLDVLPADAPVTVLQRLGLEDENVRTVELADLDRDVEPDHLTALVVDSGVSAAARELARLLGLAQRLRRPGGCPWDADQTHHSLTRYLLEEAYEVVEAVEALPPDAPAGSVPADAYLALEDELGDLLYQVIFHAVLAEEARAFDMAGVARGIHDKLVRRHPHVFAETEAETSSDVMRNWEQIKKDEKGATSIVAGITAGLPSLLYAHKLLRKAASVGLDPGGRDDALARLDAVLVELRTGGDRDLETQLGDLLAAAIVLARSGSVDAESALRGWAVRFRRRFEAMEHLAEAKQLELAVLPPAEVAALWVESGGET
jgi:tetrapyrrole methylase family protein / MazG family protein